MDERVDIVVIGVLGAVGYCRSCQIKGLKRRVNPVIDGVDNDADFVEV